MLQVKADKVTHDYPGIAQLTYHDDAEDLSRKEILKVLKRAVRDSDFIARLTYAGSKALQDYKLTNEAKAALLAGDIGWIEARVGKLDAELRTWLHCRLEQEIW